MESSQENIIAVPKIRELREKAELTQLELSRQVGVTEASIQNWERGRAGVEQIERVINLCIALNCKPEDLIEYREVSETKVPSKKSKGRERLKKMRQKLGTDNLNHTSSDKPKTGSKNKVI